LQHFYLARGRKTTPLSHLIMLAPANFGSALAQLGKKRLSRLKSWLEGVQPGTGVLDWLELGSPESWELNQRWLEDHARIIGPRGTWPFVLIGQSIDHKLYDHLNAYTGEMGSDGVVRTAAANINAHSVTLKQQKPRAGKDGQGYTAPKLSVGKTATCEDVPMAVLPGLSHSGERMGIMRSVPAEGGDHPTVTGILDCLNVKTRADYDRLRERFDALTANTQASERVETLDLPGPFDRTRIKDPCSMVIFRVTDDQGRAVTDFDLLLTAGGDDDPDRLPPGFFVDRQKNSRAGNTVTYYVNHALMKGSDAVRRKDEDDGDVIRGERRPAESLGIRITPHPGDGFVHYLPASLHATPKNLDHFVRANQTTLVDIVLRRVIHSGVFELTRDLEPHDFTDQPPGPLIE
jgi:hypothetical protein